MMAYEVYVRGSMNSLVAKNRNKLPEFIEPESVEQAIKRITFLGTSFHEHAYILGKTLQWCYANTPRARQNEPAGFQWFVHHNFWFSITTAFKMMEYAKRCDHVGELVEYGSRKKILDQQKIDNDTSPNDKQDDYTQHYYDVKQILSEFFPEAWLLGGDERATYNFPIEERRKVALKKLLNKLTRDQKSLIWLGIFLAGELKLNKGAA